MFEVENRDFFERSVNARTAGYYSITGVTAAIKLASDERRKDEAYQFLIKNEVEKIVGRLNLTRVRRTHFHSAELGYRVAQAECGKGYARVAVGQALSLAFEEKKLMRIEAVARPENVGSVSVLLRNGFAEFGRSLRSFELAGTWYDRLYFEKHAEA